MLHLIGEYSQNSTIAGLYHAFKPGQTKLGGAIWILVISTFFAMGSYLSIKNYNQVFML